jgi:hypothetical protein
MRSDSGLNFSNISAGFAGVSSALAQGFDWKMRQQLEDMKDQRAENMSRMNWTRDMLKQGDMLDRQRALQESSQRFAETSQTGREAFLADQARKGQQSYLDALDARASGAERAQKVREDAASERQRVQLGSQTRVEWLKAIQEQNRQEAQLQMEISRAVQANVDISGEPDAQKRQAAMAADPVIGPMTQKLGEMTGKNGARDQINASFAMALHNLGDPDFKGVKIAVPGQSDPGSSGPSGSSPQLIPNDGGGASTPNNPLAPAVPAYPTDNVADNTAAINRSSFTGAPPPGSPPGSSAAGMSPTAGYSVRGPVTSMVGPLQPVPQPQLVPTVRSAALGSGGAFPGIANPTGAPPSLIQPQGF